MHKFTAVDLQLYGHAYGAARRRSSVDGVVVRAAHGAAQPMAMPPRRAPCPRAGPRTDDPEPGVAKDGVHVVW